MSRLMSESSASCQVLVSISVKASFPSDRIEKSVAGRRG